MTTFIPRADTLAATTPAPAATAWRAGPRHRASGQARRAAFTLTEVLIAASLSAFILAGVLSTFLLLGRTGLNASAYAEMNARLRTAIERFDRDVRLASDVRWQDERRLTLVFSQSGGADLPEVTYAFEPAADPASPGRFVRQAEGASVEVLVRDVAPDFAFRRYRLPTESGEEALATGDLDTKQLEVRLRALRPDARAPAASQLALSARCVLRNKNAGS